jgi:rod shape-determining protein MreC
MAFAGGGLNNQSARDSAPGPRFFIFAVLSVVLMYFDQRDGLGDRIRYVLQAAAYPIQVAIGSPRMLWSATTDLFETRGSLRSENTRLKKLEQELALRTMRFEALEQENARLRDIKGALPPLVERTRIADVVNADLGRLRQRLVIDKGDRDELFRSQAIVDNTGLMGQLVRVGPWSAEVMLITDPEHAVPVEDVRSGFRTIAVGTGDDDSLQLPYVPITADVKPGDLLVTSGLGGVFPAGIPVGEIIENKRDPDEILARVTAKPRAALTHSRQVVALWFDPSNPAAPPSREMIESLPEAPVAQPVTTTPGAKPAAKPEVRAAQKPPTRPAAPYKSPVPAPAPARPAATAPEPAAAEKPAGDAPAEAR